MISEKDRAVVTVMVRTGMSLDTLKRIFPEFDAADIEKIYKEEKERSEEDSDEEISISCNCS